MQKVIVKHLEDNEKLNDAQHGFRSKRSCLSQLLQHHDQIIKIVHKGDNCDVVYLDFSQAFDKVDNGILLRRMKELQIDGEVAL